MGRIASKIHTDFGGSHLGSLLLVLLFLQFPQLGCSEGPQVVSVNAALSVSGTFTAGSAESDSKIQAYYSDAKGVRQPFESFTLAATGEFSFPLIVKTHVIEERWQSRPERLAAMGQTAPADPLADARFGDAPIGFVRLELFDPAIVGNAAVIPYFQSYLAIPRSKVLQAGGRIELANTASGTMSLSSVGAKRVQVVDKLGAPIAGARVIVSPIKPEAFAIGLGNPWPAWEAPIFAPVAQLTDAEGLAYALPIPANVAIPRFQVMAEADGYCPNITNQMAFDLEDLTTSVEVIVLESCAEGEVLEVSFAADFAPSIKKYPLPADPALDFGFINTPLFKVSLTSSGQSFRGVKVLVYDNPESTGSPVAEEDYPTFAPEILAPVPPSFLSEGSIGGQFAIELRPITFEGEKVDPLFLRAIYSTTTSTVTALDFSLSAPTGAKGIIAANAGTFFQVDLVKESACLDGEEIGFIFGVGSRSNTVFVPCEIKPIRLQYADLKSSLQTTVSGDYTVTVVRKDRYGNISPAATDGSDQFSIYIDFSAPNLAAADNITPLTYDVDFGFAPAGTNFGTFYDFGANPVTITPGTAANFVVNFATEAACRLLEDDTSGRAHLIHDFRLAANATDLPIDDFEGGTACLTPLALSAGSLSFPDDTGAPAVFFLQVRDLAGQVSSPQAFEIPGCSTSPGTTCWQP